MDGINITVFAREVGSGIGISMRSKDYHDYVIKDGKLVGAFDEMYQHSSDVPWQQDQSAYFVSSTLDIAMLQHYQKAHGISSILELGCGLGCFTNRIHQEVGNGLRVVGADISKTAISQAKETFPNCSFEAFDILNDDIGPWSGQFDLVMEKEVLWYVLDDLDRFFERMSALSSRFVYFSQTFPDCFPFLGSDVFPDAAALEHYVGRYFTVVNAVTERHPDHNNREVTHIIAEK